MGEQMCINIFMSKKTYSAKFCVKDIESLEPIENAKISLEGTSINAITNSEGIAEITDLKKGSYVVTIEHDEYNATAASFDI